MRNASVTVPGRRTWSRRDFFRSGLMGGAVTALATPVAATPISARPFADSIYMRLLGVEPHFAGHEHTTFVGGSRMPPEVMRAMAEANEYFVDMHQLVAAAGRRIAEVTHAEAGLVTAGSFSALILGGAACLTGSDLEKIVALPHPTWDRRECLIQTGHRFGYDRAYRAAGMVIVEAETREQFVEAISDRTAMIAGLASVERRENPPPNLMMPEELIAIGRSAGVPVLIDAASEIPPVANISRYTEMGADLVVISGGKGIRGPQGTGMLAGRTDLIEAARLHAFPNSHLGRGMKVGKEAIVGLVVALNRWVSLDHEAVIETWNRKSRYLVEMLQGIPGLTAEYAPSPKGYADVRITWDEAVIPLTLKDAQERLAEGTPKIMWFDPVFMTRCLEDGEEIVVARRLRAFFAEHVRTA